MPLKFGDVVVARFRLQHAWGSSLSMPRPCLVIRDDGAQIEVAYGTSAPEYTERYNAQIVRHEAGEVGAWPAGAFLLRRLHVLPNTPDFFPEGANAVARLSQAQRGRARRALDEMAALEKWESPKHATAWRAELRTTRVGPL